MTDAERAAIEQACLRLMAAYCITADHHDCEGWVGLFCEDGTWTQPTGEKRQGHDTLRTFFKGRPVNKLSRHVSTSALVTVIDEDHATGVSYALVLRGSQELDGPVEAPVDCMTALVEYHDEFRRTPDGWRFQSRRGQTVFRRT